MDHNLSAARQRAVIAIASQKQQIVNEANKAIAELDESAQRPGRDVCGGRGPRWRVDVRQRRRTGAVVLRKVEPPAPEPEESADD
jgi:hypothetical protein